MAYMEQLQSGLQSLVAAAEAGRRSADEMLGPMNGAIGDITGAALELENLPVVGPQVGTRLRRILRGIDAAQSRVGEVAAQYNQAVTVAGQVQQRLGALQEQTAKVGAAINRIGGQISPALGTIFPSSLFAAKETPTAEAVKPFPHLLILQPLGLLPNPITSTWTRRPSMNCGARPAFAGLARSAWGAAVPSRRWAWATNASASRVRSSPGSRADWGSCRPCAASAGNCAP